MLTAKRVFFALIKELEICVFLARNHCGHFFFVRQEILCWVLQHNEVGIVAYIIPEK